MTTNAADAAITALRDAVAEYTPVALPPVVAYRVESWDIELRGPSGPTDPLAASERGTLYWTWLGVRGSLLPDGTVLATATADGFATHDRALAEVRQFAESGAGSQFIPQIRAKAIAYYDALAATRAAESLQMLVDSVAAALTHTRGAHLRATASALTDHSAAQLAHAMIDNGFAGTADELVTAATAAVHETPRYVP